MEIVEDEPVVLVDDVTNEDMLPFNVVCSGACIIGAGDGVVTKAGELAFNGVLLALLMVAPVLLQLLSLLIRPIWNFGLYGRSDVAGDGNGGVQSRSSVGDVGRLKCCKCKQ